MRRSATAVTTSPRAAILIAIFVLLTHATNAQVIDGTGIAVPLVAHGDPMGDATPRRTDLSTGLSPEDVRERVVDLLHISIGQWAPDAPSFDLFAGHFANTAPFFRLDLIMRGLVNPPGGLDPFSFTPFRYGPRPVFGFVEIDMDGDIDTGGETEAPEYRYLSNVARFGGNMTRPDLASRVALSGSAIDGHLETPPFVERSGEEFHLALLGEEFAASNIEVIAGDNDRRFEEGEIWNLHGTFFHRAHGYEPFAITDGGNVPGEYAPRCTLRFAHDPNVNRTVVSLVFPLTNLGAAIMNGQPPQPNDQDPTNQASVLEALEDLHLSAKILAHFPTDKPGAELIKRWATKEPQRGLNVGGWRVTALLGTSYNVPNVNAVQLVWTDIFPNVIPGDMNGSGRADLADATRVAAFIAEADALDGIDDASFQIPDFARNFVIADVNYDGFVDLDDIRLADRRGDDDADGDIDLRDLARFQTCFGRNGGAGDLNTVCGGMDFSGDGRVDWDDVEGFRERFGGPRMP